MANVKNIDEEDHHLHKCPFSPGQMEALTALCDTFLPSLNISEDQYHQMITDSTADDGEVLKFFQTSASMARTPQDLAVLLGEKINHPKTFLSNLALFVLSTWLGTFIVCGWKSLSSRFPYFQRFSKISLEKREKIIHSWSDSCFYLLRLLYTSVKIFTHLVYFTQIDEKNDNVAWKAIGYCGPDPDHVDTRKLRSSKTHGVMYDEMPNKLREEKEESKEDLFGPLYKGIINLNYSKEASIGKLQNLGFQVSAPQSRNTTSKSLNPSFTIKCDAVVVGSGSGGGLVAGVLAKAGYRVIVLEKGSYIARSNLSLLEGEAIDKMYLGNGVLGSDDMNVLFLAGSTVGGGSAINWCASIRTPDHVRREWSEKFKLGLFDSETYDRALDVVCEKMGVQSEFEQEGFNSMVLRKGCENLGYPVETVPRNAPPDHYCGWCCLGCKDGKKKGTLETWLVDLVESGNGVVLPECEALKVITEKKSDKKNALGVAFEFTNHEGVKETAVIESKVTVVACGAICTPPLLKRSGLKNPNIGKNFHVHPVLFTWGHFPDNSWPEPNKKSYEGCMISSMSKVVSNFETSGYGTIIQTPALHPGIFSILMPWVSGKDIRTRMLKFSRTATLFTLARDQGSGVVNSPSNISYNLLDSDEENLSKGVEKSLRILAASGAEEIGTCHKKGKILKVKEASEQEFESFVREESLRPSKNLETPIGSAHQMGSCRMGIDPKDSVVNSKGETWEVEGLFVADSSVFPTALGVNPMVTVQAIAYCTAQSVLEVLGKKNKSSFAC